MKVDLTPLIAGLDRTLARALDGAARGLAGAAAGVTLDMRDSLAHGDQTGATHAAYTAYAVGWGGRDGAQELGRSVQAVQQLNPGHVATASVRVDGIGVIITAPTDYQSKLETESAGLKAVLGPTIAASGQRFTQAAASGSKRALGG